jgi:translation elongation factor EF-Ts
MQIKAKIVKGLREKADGECRRIKRALKMMEGGNYAIL